jgi:hypothetical protein
VRRLSAPRQHAFGLTGRLRRGARASRQAAGETAGDAPGFAMDILFEGGAIAFALAAVFVVLAIVAPLIGVVVDLVLAIMLTTPGVAGRLLFRRPWSVEAVSPYAVNKWSECGVLAGACRAAAPPDVTRGPRPRLELHDL